MRWAEVRWGGEGVRWAKVRGVEGVRWAEVRRGGGEVG